VDRLKINGSLARKALNDLEEKGQIKKVVGHSKLSIYSKFLAAGFLSGFGLGGRRCIDGIECNVGGWKEFLEVVSWREERAD
jgi:hypothetical protein